MWFSLPFFPLYFFTCRWFRDFGPHKWELPLQDIGNGFPLTVIDFFCANACAAAWSNGATVPLTIGELAFFATGINFYSNELLADIKFITEDTRRFCAQNLQLRLLTNEEAAPHASITAQRCDLTICNAAPLGDNACAMCHTTVMDRNQASTHGHTTTALW